MLVDSSDLIDASFDIKESEALLLKIDGTIVTIFGSARTKPNTELYSTVELVSEKLAQLGCNILTGGGPGVMEAGNVGAFKHRDKVSSIGFNVKLPKEQKENPYLTDKYTFNKIYIRKNMLINYSAIFIIFPGGFGTMDELFELLTLVQNKKISYRKIFLYDSKFYNPMITFLKNSLLDYGMIAEYDLKLFRVVDNIEDILSECNCLEKI